MGSTPQGSDSVSVDARAAAVVDDVRAKIAREGFAVIGVFPTPERPGVPFAYTVGMTARELPELAIYGLPISQAHQVLNWAVRQIADGGRAPEPGHRIEGVFGEGMDLAAVEMADTHDLAKVVEVYGSVGSALQLCWPDADGLMPWEQGSKVGQHEQPVYGAAPLARKVYRAARLSLDSIEDLARLIAGEPKGELTAADTQADVDRRAGWGAHALVGYASHMRCLRGDIETVVHDMFGDLRHLIDALGLDWEAAVETAERNYRYEILGQL